MVRHACEDIDQLFSYVSHYLDSRNACTSDGQNYHARAAHDLRALSIIRICCRQQRIPVKCQAGEGTGCGVQLLVLGRASTLLHTIRYLSHPPRIPVCREHSEGAVDIYVLPTMEQRCLDTCWRPIQGRYEVMCFGFARYSYCWSLFLQRQPLTDECTLQVVCQSHEKSSVRQLSTDIPKYV